MDRHGYVSHDPSRHRPEPTFAPKPRPQPKPISCPDWCGPVIQLGGKLEDVTCPCGQGYYDGNAGLFIPGDWVSKGEAPSKKEYQAHMETCNYAHPGWDQNLHDIRAAKRKNQTRKETRPSGGRHLSVNREAASDSEGDRSRHRSPRNRHTDDDSEDDTAIGSSFQSSSTRASRHQDSTTVRGQDKSFFVPEDGIRQNVLEYTLGRVFSGGASFKLAQRDGKRGFMVTTKQRIDPKTMSKFLSDLKTNTSKVEEGLRNNDQTDQSTIPPRPQPVLPSRPPGPGSELSSTMSRDLPDGMQSLTLSRSRHQPTNRGRDEDDDELVTTRPQRHGTYIYTGAPSHQLPNGDGDDDDDQTVAVAPQRHGSYTYTRRHSQPLVTAARQTPRTLAPTSNASSNRHQDYVTTEEVREREEHKSRHGSRQEVSTSSAQQDRHRSHKYYR